MRYSAIVRAVYSSVWAILPEKLEAIAEFLHMKVAGGTSAPEIINAIRAENAAAAARVKSLATGKPGSVAVLPLYGLINQRASGDFSGPSGTSVQEFTQQFRQAVNDPNVTAIVIDVDSPGGTVSGVDELATEIFNARKQKKITAVSNCLCASAAYYLASQASEMVVSPSSLTGSIGVYQLHEDDSAALDNMGVKFTFISAGKYKTEGNSFQPLDDEARTAMQGVVDDFYGMFTKAVARGRGVAVKSVVNGFGQGRCLTAQDAVKQGLADRIATFDEVLGKYGVKTSSSASARAEGFSAKQQLERELAAKGESLVTGKLVYAGVETDGTIVAKFAADNDTVVDDDDEMNDAECTCECDSCQAGDCSGCTHEGCDPDEENCEGCGMASAAKPDPDLSKAQAEARSRRLRLASL
jgi:signal peptide peptidase SppA